MQLPGLAEQFADVLERSGVLEYVAEQLAQRFGPFPAHLGGLVRPALADDGQAFWARVCRMACCPERCRSAW